MVKYSTIFRTIEDYVVKCDDYPKAQALKYFEENKDNFLGETYDEGVNPVIHFSQHRHSPMGHLEKIQYDLQKEVEFSMEAQGIMEEWAYKDFQDYQAYLNGDYDKIQYLWNDYYNDYVLGVKHPVEDEIGYEWVNEPITSNIKYVDEMMDMSPPLAQDTILHRYGRIPLDIGEGEHGVFNGYTSTSYNYYMTADEEFHKKGWIGDNRYQLKIYAPKGTNGVLLSDKENLYDGWQSEFLLNRNQKFIVLSKNEETREAEILLY